MTVEISSLPLSLRVVVVEDIDTHHEGADEEENFFWKLMADTFSDPLESFVVTSM